MWTGRLAFWRLQLVLQLASLEGIRNGLGISGFDHAANYEDLVLKPHDTDGFLLGNARKLAIENVLRFRLGDIKARGRNAFVRGQAVVLIVGISAIGKGVEERLQTEWLADEGDVVRVEDGIWGCHCEGFVGEGFFLVWYLEMRWKTWNGVRNLY
jgi:hypothetical protein